MFDVRCAVDFVIGTGTLTVRDCLRLERHSVVRLDQSAGSDLELRVHGVAVASGEVVIIDDNSALRVSRVSPPAGIEAA
jgi:flagellar motor switch/type III secretory pathway protein FliN